MAGNGTAPALTIGLPCFNRAWAIREHLTSLLHQEDVGLEEFELVIVDDGSTDFDFMRRSLTAGADLGLRLRYFRIDVTKLGDALFQASDGANNPACALNTIIQQAHGDRIVLTSPEIIHLRPRNLRLILDFDLPPKTVGIGDVVDATWNNFIGGGPYGRSLHFLNLYHRADLLAIGGFDEAFMQGIAYEDTEFALRWRRLGYQELPMGPAVTALHLAHDRIESRVEDRAVVAAYQANEHLYHQRMAAPVRPANDGKEWGCPTLIIDQWSHC